ncbi:MAG TPA: hypothetical protein VKB50_18730 [Vicinamibacterales bacterium]|nr:hypothetical protein [Vicinamibacterales bacterium]
MAIARMPEALRERLGDDGAEGLVTLFESAREEWTDDVLTMAVDRFERRLTNELSLFRIDFTREISVLRQDFTREISAVRQDCTREIAGTRVELLKWSFLFWVGQVAAMAGLLAFMLRP